MSYAQKKKAMKQVDPLIVLNSAQWIISFCIDYLSFSALLSYSGRFQLQSPNFYQYSQCIQNNITVRNEWDIQDDYFKFKNKKTGVCDGGMGDGRPQPTVLKFYLLKWNTQSCYCWINPFRDKGITFFILKNHQNFQRFFTLNK